MTSQNINTLPDMTSAKPQATHENHVLTNEEKAALEQYEKSPPKIRKAIPERKRSKGEQLFDYITYGGFGFVLNLGLSVLITDYFTHGKGENILRFLTKKSTSAIHSMSGANPDKIESKAYGFWKTNLLMSGGHVVMIPIKLMEDSKRHMVHRFNLMLGVDQPILKDGKIVPVSSLTEDELPHLSEDQPKQGWFRTAYRRVLGVTATMTIGTLMGKNLLHNVENTLTDKMLLPSIRAVPIKSVQNLAENDRFQRYARLVSLDQFFTAVTSIVAYMTNGAKKHPGGDLFEVDPPITLLAENLPEHATPLASEANTPDARHHLPTTSIVADHIVASASPQLSVGAA